MNFATTHLLSFSTAACRKLNRCIWVGHSQIHYCHSSFVESYKPITSLQVTIAPQVFPWIWLEARLRMWLFLFLVLFCDNILPVLCHFETPTPPPPPRRTIYIKQTSTPRRPTTHDIQRQQKCVQMFIFTDKACYFYSLSWETTFRNCSLQMGANSSCKHPHNLDSWVR